jgi:hypothetical protein
MFLGIFDTLTSTAFYTNGETYFNNTVGNIDFIKGTMNLLRQYNTTTESFWIPGDWGYIHNTANTYEGAVEAGLEGENIIYLGGLFFWGHTLTNVMPQKLTWWKSDVATWGDGKGGSIKGSSVLQH